MKLNKVITASAGTGKTYRLSLEFIHILLLHRTREIHFSEICVVTFTRKAAAEIRNRIIDQLRELVQATEDGLRIRESMVQNLHYTITEEDLVYLKDVYRDILLHKHQLMISTIDSLLFGIFQSHIAPYIGIVNPTIDTTANKAIKGQLFDFMLQPANLEIIKPLFQQSRSKTIESYDEFLNKIIDERWLFHLLLEQQMDKGIPSGDMLPVWEAIAQLSLDVFSGKMKRILHDWCTELKNRIPDAHPMDYLKDDYRNLWFSDRDMDGDPCQMIEDYFTHPDQLIRDRKLWLKSEPFWNRIKFSARKFPVAERLEAELEESVKEFSRYLMYRCVMPEQQLILDFCKRFFEFYDTLKIQTGVFTYADIAYYTYRYLYDPELSLIERNTGQVSNRFYELLTNRIRFLLIDEFQDTSIIQFQILQPIIQELISGESQKDYGCVIVVGDEKQSIYRWRNGERELLSNIPQLLSHYKKESLDVSFRSYPTVMDFINQVFTNISNHPFFTEENIRWKYKNVGVSDNHCEQLGGVRLRLCNLTQEDTNTLTSDELAVRNFVEEFILRNTGDEVEPIFKDTAILTRRNEDLKRIAMTLNDRGIDFIWESSYSLLDHHAVKPLLHLLRFLASGNWIFILRFLRSDLVLLESHTLKKLLSLYRTEPGDVFTAKAMQFPEVSRIITILATYNGRDLLPLLQHIIQAYGFIRVWSSETDCKNLQRFLDIVAEFTLSHGEHCISLQGFLHHCEQLREENAVTQMGLDNKNILNLMTVHKSKGLQFETVYFYGKVSGHTGNFTSMLTIYRMLKKPQYSEIEQYAFSCNFDSVIRKSEFEKLVNYEEIQSDIEELNSYYVAFTRAAKNLGIYLTYTHKGGLEKFVEQELSKESGIPIPKMLFKSVHTAAQSPGWNVKREPFVFDAEAGTYHQTPEEKTIGETTWQPEAKYFRDHVPVPLRERDDLHASLEADMYVNFVVEQKTLMGTAAHEMLSHIRTGSEAEMLTAYQRMRERYGSMLSDSRLQAIRMAVTTFISEHEEIFHARWDRVFTEVVLFDTNGREFRLDRFMVDEKTRHILIVDYKTGKAPDREQLKNYEALMLTLPFVREHGYRVESVYLRLEIR